MQTLLKFLLGPRASWIPATLLAFWAVVILPGVLWALGVFAMSGLNMADPPDLSRAIDSSEPIEAIGAARLVSEPFGDEMLRAIEASSATFERAKMLGPSAEALKNGDAVKHAWVRRYVCGLEGWGEYRPLVRTLMVNGLGGCPDSAKLWARSPILDGTPQIVAWLLFPLLALLVLAPPFLACLILKVRSAYHWLYSSSVIKAPSSQAEA